MCIIKESIFYKTRIFASLQIAMLVVQENNKWSTIFIF